MNKQKYDVWTKEEEKFLLENNKTMTNKVIAEKLNRSEGSIKNKIYKQNNKKVRVNKKKVFNEKDNWTREEEQYLKENYGIMTNQSLIEQLNTTNYFLNRKADELKLMKSSTARNAEREGLNVYEVKVKIGNKYEVRKNIMGGNKQSRIKLYFQGELIQETKRHITLRNYKLGRCETFLKVDILLGEYMLKEVV